MVSVGGEGAVGVLGILGLALPLRQQMLGRLFGVGRVELQKLRPGGPADRFGFRVGGQGNPRGQRGVYRHQKPPAVADAQRAGLAAAVLEVTLAKVPAVRPPLVQHQRTLFSGAQAGYDLQRMTNSLSPMRAISVQPACQNMPAPLFVGSCWQTSSSTSTRTANGDPWLPPQRG